MLDVVITGGDGFIGQALLKRLHRDGFKTLSLSRVDGDLSNPSNWKCIPSARILVHLAAASYIPDSWLNPSHFIVNNISSTQNAVEWCRGCNAYMVFSSAYVYGSPLRLPIKETDQPQPNNPYALSKLLAEKCIEFGVEFMGIDAPVLRLFNVYGHGQRDEFLIPTIIKQLKGDSIHLMDLSPRRDYVYIEDVVDAFMRAIEM